MKYLATLTILATVCLAASPWTSSRSGGANAAVGQEDLEKLQGTWELVTNTAAAEGKFAQSVQQVKGDKVTVTRYDASNKVIGSHTAEFKLTRVGNIPVYSYWNTKVKGKLVTDAWGKGTFIYRVDGDTLYEVAGFIEGENYGRKQPYMGIWKRVKDQ